MNEFTPEDLQLALRWRKVAAQNKWVINTPYFHQMALYIVDKYNGEAISKALVDLEGK